MRSIGILVLTACGGGLLNPDGGQDASVAAQCLGSPCASSAKDCHTGERCNTALNPPRCETIYCGAIGSACADDTNDAENLCESRTCSGGICATAPDLSSQGPVDLATSVDLASGCGQPGDAGNSKGVGKYCQSGSDCSSGAPICSVIGDPNTHFCTTVCSGTSDHTTCGENATCACQGGLGCGCTPNSCI